MEPSPSYKYRGQTDLSHLPLSLQSIQDPADIARRQRVQRDNENKVSQLVRRFDSTYFEPSIRRVESSPALVSPSSPRLTQPTQTVPPTIALRSIQPPATTETTLTTSPPSLLRNIPNSATSSLSAPTTPRTTSTTTNSTTTYNPARVRTLVQRYEVAEPVTDVQPHTRLSSSTSSPSTMNTISSTTINTTSNNVNNTPASSNLSTTTNTTPHPYNSEYRSTLYFGQNTPPRIDRTVSYPLLYQSSKYSSSPSSPLTSPRGNVHSTTNNNTLSGSSSQYQSSASPPSFNSPRGGASTNRTLLVQSIYNNTSSRDNSSVPSNTVDLTSSPQSGVHSPPRYYETPPHSPRSSTQAPSQPLPQAPAHNHTNASSSDDNNNSNFSNSSDRLEMLRQKYLKMYDTSKLYENNNKPSPPSSPSASRYSPSLPSPMVASPSSILSSYSYHTNTPQSPRATHSSTYSQAPSSPRVNSAQASSPHTSQPPSRPAAHQQTLYPQTTTNNHNDGFTHSNYILTNNNTSRSGSDPSTTITSHSATTNTTHSDSQRNNTVSTIPSPQLPFKKLRTSPPPSPLSQSYDYTLYMSGNFVCSICGHEQDVSRSVELTVCCHRFCTKVRNVNTHANCTKKVTPTI